MKELSAIINSVVKAAQQAGEVRDLSFSVALEDVEGYNGVAIINLVAPNPITQHLIQQEQLVGVIEKAAEPTEKKGKRGSKADKKEEPETKELHFNDHPIEIAAGVLALYGPKANYAQEEIAAAGELLASGSHGNVEEMAGDILAVFQDCNDPKMLNTALVSIGGMVIDWWDDLADHAARVAFFSTLKNSLPHEREAIEPVIYAQDDTDGIYKFEGKGQLEKYNALISDSELSGVSVTQTTAEEFKKRSKPVKEKKVDIGKLKEEGLKLVRTHANSGKRDAVAELLVKFKAISPDTQKPSWTFIPDDQVVAAVDALKAL